MTQGQNTSGSYDFAPTLGELVIYAFGQCGIRRTALTQQHLADANTAADLLTSTWSAKGVNLWQVDLQTVALNQGQSTYPVPANTIVMLDGYCTLNSGAAAIDRIILPISRTEYASYPNKNQQGFPTTFWFDRLLTPSVTLWPVPDGTQSAFNYYRLRQTQDSVLANAGGVEVPVYLLEPFAIGLAFRLAMMWAPDRAPGLGAWAMQLYNENIAQNIETASIYISPQLAGYFR